MRTVGIALAFVLLVVAAETTDANMLVNGGFEQGITPDPVMGYTWIPAGNSGITSWNVTGDGVDYDSGVYSTAAEGIRFLDLNHLDAGGVDQSFASTPGQMYRLTFSLAGNPDGNPVVKTVRVSAGTEVQDHTFDVSGHSWRVPGWQEKTFLFTANASSTAVAFISLTSGPYGPLLDNVSVVAVPEPASVFALVCGFGLFGHYAKRKRGKR